jgi:hypothetical protein
MEAKEKAGNLVQDFYNVNAVDVYHGINWSMAIECAIICVDEIINELIELDKYEHVPKSLIEYWQEVRQEINNLTI